MFLLAWLDYSFVSLHILSFYGEIQSFVRQMYKIEVKKMISHLFSVVAKRGFVYIILIILHKEVIPFGEGGGEYKYGSIPLEVGRFEIADSGW